MSTSGAASPPAAGRTFLVTGGNTGIGLATAIALARDGARVYIACRSAAPGETAADRIKAASGSDTVWLLPLDLASLDSVRACAERFLDRDEPLHVLVNNAGVGGQRGVTADGFEQHFGVNHLGHYALTQLLLDRITASGPGARVVNVSSAAHYNARGIDFTALRRPTATFAGAREYAVSKLCNVLFTQELARRRAGTGVTCYALHPGVVASDIWRRVPRLARPVITRRMLTTEQGAVTSVHCATSPAVAAESGLFYDNCAVREPSPLATRELAELLWKRSAEWTRLGLAAFPAAGRLVWTWGGGDKLGLWTFLCCPRWRRCWPSRWTGFLPATTSSSPSGTGSVPSCSATATRSSSAAGTSGR